MINLQTGSNSVWLSLRETLPAGSTSSNFKFNITNDIRGESHTFYPADLTPTYKWSSFRVDVGLTEVLGYSTQSVSIATVNLVAGMYHFTVTDVVSSTVLETGKCMVIENKSNTVLSRPAKTTTALKR